MAKQNLMLFYSAFSEVIKARDTIKHNERDQDIGMGR